MCPVSHITVEMEVAYLKRRAASLGYRMIKERRTKAADSVFKNFGKSWDDDDIDYIVDALAKDVCLKEMVKKVGRSPGAILGKLGNVGALAYDNGMRGYAYKKGPLKGQVYMSYAKLKELEKRYER